MPTVIAPRARASIIEIADGKASVIEKSMKFYERQKSPADAVLDADAKSIYG